MIEAVGERVLADLLRHARPAARARRQGRASRRSCSSTSGCWRRVDQYTWITKYIFPGGALPSMRAIEEIVRDHTRLRVDRRRRASAPTTPRTLRRLAGALRRARRRGRRARLRRDVPPHVGLLPRVLRGRLRHRLPRRRADRARRSEARLSMATDRRRRVARGHRPARSVGDDLPVGLRAWDGSEAGPRGAPVVVLAQPARPAPPALAARRARAGPGLRHRRPRRRGRPGRRPPPRVGVRPRARCGGARRTARRVEAARAPRSVSV